ncbi:alcohol dehydrogenase [Mycolicibacterium chubuense]|uniref:hydroxyacid-oxoacid transhydrogenase n=1 Tax=Mycolicibacterium chubuense TaxID=1800 RepID=A0A0J6VQ80_MYCCU|nr:hydroxyacid-oxoacid transhydrogenase [Mycolicibacterium chubuense]KMO73210.1 NAD-dependent methanol dehydrogenase [Mycolicibacterium chubuense]ORA56777.1 alcohol dehydrogenase [Mycolicibacterium chubuense]SPX98746.1 alcohol dehydrogenase, class IV [Mycolicibacterium chubuense]
MSCCHSEFDTAFTVDASRITFGRGCVREVGDRATALGMRRVALFSDASVARLEFFDTAMQSLRDAGLDVVTYTESSVEPTDESFRAATAFATETKPDGYVSVGGGSVIDTAKAANLYATHPADFADYVNAPIGAGRPVPGPLAPHIACPTTSGTGSEVTGIAIFDLLSLHAKTGIASPALRPSEALVDPDSTDTLPGEVVACSGLDVLSHALESYTARPFTRRAAPAQASQRPMSQGANPWSDVGSREALGLLGRYLERAVTDAADREAREQTMWAATLAGIAFGNAGVHIPHAMAYAVAGQVRDFHPSGYPGDAPIVPHGMSVILNAPAAFRLTAPADPARHLAAAAHLGADVAGAADADAGAVLADHLVRIMRAVGMPDGLAGVGYTESDATALAAGAWPQQRLLGNAPIDIDEALLANTFRQALRYWS